MTSAALSLDSVVRLSESQVAADLGKELTILNTSTRVYYGLEDPGPRIWALLRVPVRLSEVRDRIVEEYQVEPEAAASDLVEFVTSLVGAGLVDVVIEHSDPVARA